MNKYRYLLAGIVVYLCSLTAYAQMHSAAEIIQFIIEGMCAEEGIDVPGLGRMAIVPEVGKKPKLIFHGGEELNGLISET